MTPLVRIHDLCLHLNGRAILHHVDLELPRHGISVLLGRSGSGKTSFLRCLNRLHDCTKDSRMQGQVELLLDGKMQDISRLQGEEALGLGQITTRLDGIIVLNIQYLIDEF